MTGAKPVAALLRAKVGTEDSITITKVTTLKYGYMVKSEFENELGVHTAKVFSSESAARSYASGQQIIKVAVNWELT